MRIFLLFILLSSTTILFAQVDTLNFALLYPKAGPYKDFYKSGKIKTLGAFALVDSIECINCFDKDQNTKISRAQTRLMRVGEWKEYYENGKIKSAGTYKGIHE